MVNWSVRFRGGGAPKRQNLICGHMSGYSEVKALSLKSEWGCPKHVILRVIVGFRVKEFYELLNKWGNIT